MDVIRMVDSLQKQPKHVALEVLPSPVIKSEISTLFRYLSRQMIMTRRRYAWRTDEEGKNGIDLGVGYLHRLERGLS